MVFQISVRVRKVGVRKMASKVTSKGQVTVPKAIREKLGIWPQTEIEFEIVGNQVIMRKVPGHDKRGKALIRKMRGRGTVTMSTDEIMRMTRGKRE